MQTKSRKQQNENSSAAASGKTFGTSREKLSAAAREKLLGSGAGEMLLESG